MNPVRSFRSLVRFRPIEFRSRTRRLSRAASVDDLRLQAKRRLPRAVFDYIDGGAEDERTLDRNVSGYARVEFRPRILRN
ncbi:MAG: alpha-hydroxy-acid oxidizing protein, partial [Acidimicrobiia bacterium]|nr:alpha-hydroxy-acid oxidizing protein [Acidimicrobiia bacterium]